MRHFLGFYLVLGGLCGPSNAVFSWTQVLLSSAGAEDFVSGTDSISFRSGLQDAYPFLIQNLKSCTEHSAHFCLFTRDIRAFLPLVE